VSNECAAGRTAFFGGRWTVPCPITGRHRVASAQGEGIMLCDDHFRQVNDFQHGKDTAVPAVPDLHPTHHASSTTLGEGEFYRSGAARKRRFRFFRSK
jgi:hypothetical protein